MLGQVGVDFIGVGIGPFNVLERLRNIMGQYICPFITILITSYDLFIII
jgi:hypothetical protein